MASRDVVAYTITIKTAPMAIEAYGPACPRTPATQTEVLQLCSHPVIGWQDAPPGIFGLWFIQVAAI